MLKTSIHHYTLNTYITSLIYKKCLWVYIFLDNEFHLSADHTTNFIEPGPPPLEETHFQIDDFSGEGALVFEQRVLDVINSQCGLSCGIPDNLASEGGTQMVPIYQDCWDTTDLDRRYPNGSEWKKDDCQTCTCLVS